MIKKLLIVAAMALPMALCSETLEECQQLAERNYPLVKRYDLIRQTEQFTLSNLVKGWLPQIGLSAQGTYQSAVSELPEALRNVMAAQGMSARGISPMQYRTAIDVQQTLYDGGLIRANREVARAQSAIDEARTSVDLYAVRDRVNELYFGWLLVDEQLRQNETLRTLLTSNVERLEALYNNGVAMGCDVDALRAELATVRQQQSEIESLRASLQQVLSLLCGQPVREVVAPDPQLRLSAASSSRPELALFDQQLLMFDAQEHLLRSQLKPRLGLFAQGYYGYTGLDMFHDMYHRYPTLNGIVGAKLTWNLSSLYTHRGDRQRLHTGRQGVELERETFLFNQRILTQQEQQQIERYRRLMSDDDEILRLRQRVRMAAEAKLQGGIIDTNHLLQEITREHQAAISKSIHQVEYLKAIYQLNNIQGK